jgi:alpha-L-fucosidase
MNSRTILLTLAIIAAALYSCKEASAPEPYGAIPTPQQVEWQKMEMNMFVHFGPNTFTGREWGLGTEAEDIFNPTALDCNQWASTAKAAGFKGIIITGKHHDGFCLWPNPMSTHTVAASPWKDGKGDVLKELSEACRKQGLKFGVYISPWDRNDPHYGTPEYNDVYVKTLQDVHGGKYGDVFEQWFDGANGEGPNGKKQVYDWPLFHKTVLDLHPMAIMFSDVGPGCRWVGNERGVAGRTNWSTLNTEGFTPGAGSPPTDTLNSGNVHGNFWIPAETDVSIRPGWFWRESENERVKSVNDLLGIYYTSVGRNSLLLLNVPPDTTGCLHPVDSARMIEFKGALDEIFKEDLADGAKVTASSTRGRGFGARNILDGNYDSYWAAPDGTYEATLTFTLNGKKTFNRVLLQEYIPLGQRVQSFTVEVASPDGTWNPVAEETTIGYKRIVLTEKVTTDKVRVTVKAYAPPVLNGFGLFMDTIYDRH